MLLNRWPVDSPMLENNKPRPVWELWLSALVRIVNDLALGTQSGNGSPEGVVTAPVGTLYRRLDGAAGTILYAKNSGSGNTGWGALT